MSKLRAEKARILLSVALTDDDPSFLDTLSSYLEKYARENGVSFHISRFTNGYDLLESKESYDIVFLDIQMPGLNLHRTPFNGRSCIYFSEDPTLTYLAAEVENKGITSKGVSSAVKHFVLNDQEFYRQGVSVFFEEQGMREIALRAFESSLNSTDNTYGSMMSFNRIGCVSDNNCSEIKNLVREEWGYHGFFQTDAAQHYSIYYVTELASGTDLFSTDSTGRGGKAVVKYITDNDDGELYLRLKEAVHHLHYAIANGNGMNGISPNTVVTTSTAWWQITEYVLIGTFGFVVLGSVTWLVLEDFVFSKKKKKGSQEK